MENQPHSSNPIIQHLMRPDNGYSYEEAVDELKFMVECFHSGENPEEILYNIGLEPDYLFDLIEFQIQDF